MPCILIVEDDKSTRELIQERLKDSYEIIETGDPTEALELALRHKPDGILLDLMLPKLSGFELCQTFASLSLTRLTPVFVITSKPASEYREFCLNLGAAEYIEKPIDFARLRVLLDAVLDKKPVERRSEPRVRLNVVLRLKGVDTNGRDFEVLTAADDVSASGFLASCGAPLAPDTVVEVFIGDTGEKYTGRARMVHHEWAGTPWQRYGFQFLEKPRNWILF